MRASCDWRDLPPVPRRGVNKTHAELSTPSNDPDASPPQAGKEARRRKRSRFSDLCENADRKGDGDIVIPRKRARCKPLSERRGDEKPCAGDVTMPNSLERSSDAENCVSKSASQVPNPPSEHLISSPISASNTALDGTDEHSSDGEFVLRVIRRQQRHTKISHTKTCDPQSGSPISNASSEDPFPSRASDSSTPLGDADGDSSDEEPIRRVVRRRRRDVRTSASRNTDREVNSSSPSPTPQNTSRSSSDSERYRFSVPESHRRRRSSPSSDERCAKRRRTSSPSEKNSDKHLRRRQISNMKLERRSMESVPANSSPVSESEMKPRKSCSFKAQRRRCARQSTTRDVTVPWYLLDEERRPRQLRSSSRNCAARCVYWTKTERRLFQIGKSRIHNRGLYALEDIPAFAPVIEYAGEIVTQVQSEIREWAYQSRHMEEVYMYQLRKGTTDVIDGTTRGGPAKFVNHSCEPNVVAEEIQAGGTNRVWFFSLRPIRKHEEILVDYCLSYEPGDVKRPCKCGARKCKKFLNYYGLTE